MSYVVYPKIETEIEVHHVNMVSRKRTKLNRYEGGKVTEFDVSIGSPDDLFELRKTTGLGLRTLRESGTGLSTIGSPLIETAL